MEQWDEKQRQLENEGLIEPDSSDDDEIVFVGRNGSMSDERRKEKQEGALEKDKLIFQSLVDDHGAAFGYVLMVSSMYDMLLTARQTLPCSLDRHVLRPSDLVRDNWQPSSTRSLCWPQA